MVTRSGQWKHEDVLVSQWAMASFALLCKYWDRARLIRQHQVCSHDELFSKPLRRFNHSRMVPMLYDGWF